jgi:hypothetical protein
MTNNVEVVIDSKSIFSINYYLKELIDHNVVKDTEEWIALPNEFLYVMMKEHDKDCVRKAIY